MINLDKSWLKYLWEEFDKPYMKKIKDFLESEIKTWKTIYPHPKNIFNALNTTHFNNLKVVIIGQDPYHGPNQAHGLSFSVQEWVKTPPSLQNIYKEILSDTWKESAIISNWQSWDLTSWAKQWALLLNAILTVEAWKPASHSQIGWANFTDEIIKTISAEKSWIVFLLWWAFAQSKKNLIDTSKHFILEAPHPSPFSFHRWFFWCKHFTKTNEILKKQWKKEINW